MGKMVEKKKKKGRPSLLDLQKRNLKEQQQQQQNQQKRNNNSAPHSNDSYRSAPGSAAAPTAVRRSTRRNPNPDCESPEKALTEEEDEDEDELAGKRREKKLKLVLRLPQNQKSSLNYASLNSGGSDSNAEEDNAALNSHKKRKINAIGDGSGQQGSQKGDKSISGKNLSKTFQGTTKLDSGPSTPLPDKKLLLFILDRLQKKDTYGVFSEPVDPEELPDYHEVIEHPMDFSTVRKKLASGAYANLEQFEKDVFLICTNAMQYNALDTIYFRQARSIQELAKKNFENLRQDSDDNEPEQKVVRRGRPPTKNLKKPVGRTSLEHAASEFSSDANLATGGENATLLNHDMRKGSLLLDKSSLADSSGRLNGLRNNDLYTSWLADNKFERNDEFTGSGMRGNLKHGKKQSVLDDNRRNTYRQSSSSVAGREPSVLTTFEVERKQLMPIGVLVELGYARSLARFAANLGPVAWKIAAKKIERSLPSGVKFGPGWVGENDVTQHRTLLFPLHLPGQTSESLPVTTVSNSLSVATGYAVDPKVDNLSEKPEGDDLSNKNIPYNTASAAAASTTSSTTTTTTTAATTSDGHTSKSLPMSVSTSSASPLATRAPELITVKAESIEGLKPHAGFNILNSGNVGGTGPKSPFPIQGPMIHPGMNGFNGFNLAAQMGKLPGSPRPAVFNMQSAQIHDRTNSTNIHPATANSMNSEETKFLENRSTLNSESSLPNSRNEAPAAPVPPPGFHPRPSWQGLSPQPRPDLGLSRQQKPDSVPPDLNVRFQSPGSPSPSRVDSTQPDLALQL